MFFNKTNFLELRIEWVLYNLFEWIW